MASTSAARAPRIDRAVRPAPEQRPRLTLLARPEPERSPMPFALLCTAIVVTALALMVFLNVQMSDTSYRITRLQAQSQDLSEQRQALEETNDRLGTPQELERSAREIGMVPVAEPAYIDLGTGKVLGGGEKSPQAAAPAEVPAAAAVPPAQIYDQPTTYRGMGDEGN